MTALGIFLVAFGVLVVVMPDLISYLIWGLLIMIGANILLAKWLFSFASKRPGEQSGFRFGDYEISRKK